MAKFKAKKTGLTFTTLFIAAVAAAIAITLSSYGIISGLPTWSDILGTPNENVSTVAVNDNSVYFIDCGQGDCSALISGDSVAVIDSGPGSKKYETVEKLKNLGITTVDMLILTHPHEDHIGGAAEIMNEFAVESVYMLEPSESNTPTTKVYENTLQAIVNEGITITQPEIDGTVQCGDFTLKFLGPRKDYDDHNNNSIVLRADVDGKSFLFTGDAENAPERDLIKKCKTDLDCDVLKVGHHGSSTSTSEEFYNSVTPKVAVISCGEGNDYGHPHGETLKLLQNVDVYRTDLNGTVAVSVEDGKLSVSTEKQG